MCSISLYGISDKVRRLKSLIPEIHDLFLNLHKDALSSDDYTK